MNNTLLIEIGTEELPPKALPRLSQVFTDQVENALRTAEFEFGTVQSYATPRRLALSIEALGAFQPQRREQRRGPALSAAFGADGAPTKAALGFARSCGVEVEELGRLKTGDGEWLAYTREVGGRGVAEVLPAMIEDALAALPIPKRMRWGAGEVEFVRPVHWVVVLYGETVIDCEILGCASGRLTRGHRFHHGATIELKHAGDYREALENPGFVIASFAARRARIVELIGAAGSDVGGLAILDDALLDEVTALVEWPSVIAGSFDAHFLELPAEALIASMQDHQKYFPVRNAEGALVNRFITISNIDSRDVDVVRSGNERVIRPRLADADFFYKTDRGRRLESRRDALADMLFEKRLGSLLDKTRRVETLATLIAAACGAETDASARAAALSRCDLLSEMVGEFPELQGTMGGYYALADGEGETVGRAVGEFYFPRFSGDTIPVSPCGRCVALADRLDSLVGIFGIGSAPTGDKDPYALRRAALGALRILIEGNIDLDLAEVLTLTRDGYAGTELAPDTTEQVFTFMLERLRGYYLDRGVPADVCGAVFANRPTAPLEIARRIAAVVDFRAMDAAVALAAANKRTANILKKLTTPAPTAWQRELLTEPAERELAQALENASGDLENLFSARDYTAYLQQLAGLRASIDRFFDDVMVMSEDAALRENRLALLAHLQTLFTRVADIAQLHEA